MLFNLITVFLIWKSMNMSIIINHEILCPQNISISQFSTFCPLCCQFETRQNLSKFEGSSGISSADLFGGEDKGRSSGRSSYGGGPDLQDIKVNNFEYVFLPVTSIEVL